MDNKEYAYVYNEGSFLSKIGTYGAKMGGELLYKALQLYYVTKREDCPAKVKIGIYSALAYLVAPLDFIPDFTPLVGYTDDITVVVGAFCMASMYIDDSVRARAYDRLCTILGEEIASKVK